MHSMMETEDWYVLTYVSIYYVLTRYMNGGHDVIVGLGLIPPTSFIVLLSTELCARNGSKSDTFPDAPMNI